MNKKMLAIQYVESSSDSEDDILINLSKKRQHDEEFMNVLLRNCLKKPRVCIKNYLEDVADQYSEEEFRRHFRISKSLYDSMAKKFQCTDYKNMRENCRTISASAHVAVFLWFAGHEACSYRDIADRFNLSLSSVNRVINRMVMFFSNMAPQIIVWPNDETKKISSDYWKNKCGIPAVIGKYNPIYSVYITART